MSIILNQTYPGDSIDLTYRSLGRNSYLSLPTSVIAFQGDPTYNTQSGFLLGPHFPAETGQQWGTPSASFLSLFPTLLNQRRLGESHGNRLLRLRDLCSLYSLVNRDTPRILPWVLSAALGYTGSSLVHPGSGEINLGDYLALLPELEDRIVTSLSFSNLEVSDSVFGPLNLISRNPIESRLEGTSLGGDSNTDNSYSAYSPFRFSDSPKLSGLTKNTTLIPTTNKFAQDSHLSARYSYGLVSNDNSLSSIINTQLSSYRIIDNNLSIRPGLLDQDEEVLLLYRSVGIKVLTPLDSISRGDLDLRVPGDSISSNTLLSITPPRYRTSWSIIDESLNSSSLPLDLDSTSIAYGSLITITEIFGSGSGTPVVNLDDPLAVKF